MSGIILILKQVFICSRAAKNERGERYERFNLNRSPVEIFKTICLRQCCISS